MDIDLKGVVKIARFYDDEWEEEIETNCLGFSDNDIDLHIDGNKIYIKTLKKIVNVSNNMIQSPNVKITYHKLNGSFELDTQFNKENLFMVYEYKFPLFEINLAYLLDNGKVCYLKDYLDSGEEKYNETYIIKTL